MDLAYILLSYAPTIGFCASLICMAIALRIIFFNHKGCTDCGARLNITEGSHCHTCTARKRSALQARDDYVSGLD